MSHAVTFAVPGDLATPTGGYAYDRRIVQELETLGWRVDVVNLGDGFPAPPEQTLQRAEQMLLALPPGRPVIVDGLALGVLPQAAQTASTSRPLVALVHHPLACETGLEPAQAAAFRASERAALAASRAVIVTSPATARCLADEYAVAPDRITVALPGIEPQSRSARAAKRPADKVELLAVGSLSRRKGYDVLLDALARVAAMPWRLTIVGAADRDPETAASIVGQIGRLGFEHRVEVTGAVPEARLRELYARADIFVLASRFEGYGMAYAEALAHGLPVIGTTAGAIPETVPADAAILVPPDDPVALAEALGRLIGAEPERERLATAARAATLPTWREAGLRIAAVLEGLR